MKKCFPVALLVLLLTGCETMSSLNPFAADTGPKMAELKPIVTTVNAQVAWRESVGKSDVYRFVPAVVGSTVYAASKDGTVVRIDSGKQAWKVKAEQILSGGVGANERMVVVGSTKGDIYAFSAADGTLLWSAKATSEILAAPALGEGIVVVRSGDNYLSAYDAQSGKRQWTYQRPVPALALRSIGGSLVAKQYVFAGFPGGKLLALSVANGAVLWDGTVSLPKGATELDRVSDITSLPVVAGRAICAVAYQGKVSCFDLGNGSMVWSREMSSAVGLTIDGRYLYVTDDKGAVHALDMASGASLWKQDKLLLRRVTAPVAVKNVVAVGDVQGVVHLLNRDDGSFVARVTTDGSAIISNPQILDSSSFVVQTANGGVFAIGVQ